MENLPVPLTKRLKSSLFDSFIPEPFSENDKFELLIKLKGKNVSVRKLAAYLNFLDKSYGRLTPKGIISYSRSYEHELKITELRRGSFEIVLSNFLSDPDSITALILVGLLLKYLPGIIRSALSAYRDYEEAKLAKVRRLQIKEQIKNDKHLKNLNDRQVTQLCNFFDIMYGADIRNLPKSHKFSSETVLEVEFKVKSSRGSPDRQKARRKLKLERSLDF